MGKNSRIEWTDHTFNPWIGCSKVSPGCAHCYAETLMDTRFGIAKWGPNGTRKRTSDNYWRQPLAWNLQAHRAGVKQRVFVASLADIFEDRPGLPELTEWRVELFDLIRRTDNLIWMLLTKRPENINPILFGAEHGYLLSGGDRFPNLWIGVSVENQEQADIRIPRLCTSYGCALRFVSAEPLLGPIDLQPYLSKSQKYCDWHKRGRTGHSVDWVIVGGESGPQARPMHPDWAISVRDQCQANKVPFFFKQWGEYLPAHQYRPDWYSPPGELAYQAFSEMLGDPTAPRVEFGDGTWTYRVGKRAAGSLLDQKEWRQFPS